MQNGNKTPKEIFTGHLFLDVHVRSSVNSRLPEDEIAEFLTTVEPPLNGPPPNNGHFFWRTLHKLTLFQTSLRRPISSVSRWPLRRGSTVKLNRSKARIRKTYCSTDAIHFYRSICKKPNLCLYPETVTKNRPKFRRNSTGSQGSKLVKK